MTNLHRVRLDRGYSLRDLAALVGCSYTAVHGWERGHHAPQPRHGARLRDVLGLPLDLLLAPAINDERDRAEPGPA